MSLLLIISYLFFHLPSAFIRDTYRRYKRMKMYNLEKATQFELENENFLDVSTNNESKWLLFVSVLSGLIFSLFPLFKLIHINWFLIIILNIVVYGITPFVAFIFTSSDVIHTKKTLITISSIFIVLGLIALLIAVY